MNQLQSIPGVFPKFWESDFKQLNANARSSMHDYKLWWNSKSRGSHHSESNLSEVNKAQ